MTTTVTTIDVSTIEPITHREAHGLAEEEYRRFAAMLATVADDEWDRSTDCEGWSVRDLAGHVVGAMRAAASMRELMRQQKEIKRRVRADGGNEVDHMTGLQIELTAELTTVALVEECSALVAPAARGRRRTPLPMRRFVRIPVQMGTIDETWRLGYLVDVILTRDIWMHRVDLARALGRELVLDDHDRRVVSDVVAEWARRHGEPVELHLSGPAGGSFVAAGSGDPDEIDTDEIDTDEIDTVEIDTVEIDMVEFCRVVSGREPGEGLLAHAVPF
jgi:uncharacterized protein (TIGR03083 family)